MPSARQIAASPPGRRNAWTRSGFTTPVTSMTKKARAQERAARLHQEALNCLRIAVTQEEQAHSADLIDEALKLTRRARELEDDPA